MRARVATSVTKPHPPTVTSRRGLAPLAIAEAFAFVNSSIDSGVRMTLESLRAGASVEHEYH